MRNYNKILILHPLDTSTRFLEVFSHSFKDSYFAFNKEQMADAKIKLGDLEPPCLIIYIGHGNSSSLYAPDESEQYEDKFLDVTWGNWYFQGNDVLLLSCRSNEYIERLSQKMRLIGFGNIISSPKELEQHNINSRVTKCLCENEIVRFNECYINSVIRSINHLINGDITFSEVAKYIKFYTNKEINRILKNKDNMNRVELARLLFEFRNEINYKEIQY